MYLTIQPLFSAKAFSRMLKIKWEAVWADDLDGGGGNRLKKRAKNNVTEPLKDNERFSGIVIVVSRGGMNLDSLLKTENVMETSWKGTIGTT